MLVDYRWEDNFISCKERLDGVGLVSVVVVCLNSVSVVLMVVVVSRTFSGPLCLLNHWALVVPGYNSNVLSVRMILSGLSSNYIRVISWPCWRWPFTGAKGEELASTTVIVTAPLYQLCVSYMVQFIVGSSLNPFTPELKKCILPTFQKAIVWVM